MATDLLALRLTFDTAALVLIWLVQLVIYPGFLHYGRTGFRTWPPVYTKRVTLVVLPIMLGQLALYACLLVTDWRWDVGVNIFLIVAVWAITFLRAVPLHGALDQVEDHLPVSTSLIAANWWRTGLWTMVWLLTLGRFVVVWSSKYAG